MSGCFSPYMMICSTMQTVFGFDRRSLQEQQIDLSEMHQLELRKAREEVQSEIEADKLASMRAKMALARKYRSDERYEQTNLQHKTEELKAFFTKNLPVSEISIPLLLHEAEIYKTYGYDKRCPLNVLLLHTRQNSIDYDEICDSLDNIAPSLGNIIFRRWCEKDVAHNAAILNLHALMGNIPTLVISPYYHDAKIHFSAALWEAQSDAKPLIRPLFSINCESLLANNYSSDSKKLIQERITLISTIVSGCARDSYMLMTQGLEPTLPVFLEHNPKVVESLTKPENKDICLFMINEYSSAKFSLRNSDCTSKLLSTDEMYYLASKAEESEAKLVQLTTTSN